MFEDTIVLGLQTALSAQNLWYCIVGVTIGMMVGVLPGIGAMAAIAMLLPFTFQLDPTAALIMLSGIWYGSSYGSSIAAILLNIPGTPSSAVTCLDGYPMGRDGRGGVALFITGAASFAGGSIGIIVVMVSAPTIASYALEFRSPEYFGLMLLGLVAACSVAPGSAVKGLAAVVLGIAVGTIGLDVHTGASRLTFGNVGLLEGISIAVVAMGLFGVAEVITSVNSTGGRVIKQDLSWKSLWPKPKDWAASWAPIARGSAIGSFFGTLPGVGPGISAFMAYAVEKRVASDSSRFGEGAIEGVAAPEAANNACDQTAFIPTLALGIPGSATMGLMLGALMIHGISPGPTFIVQQPAMFWGLIMSFWIGNLLLLVMNIPLVGIWVRMLEIPYRFLYPTILTLVCIGTFIIGNSVMDIWVLLAFGAAGYFMRLIEIPAAPLLLGFVLGPMIEENFRRSLLLSGGDFGIFVSSPISIIVMATTAILLIWTLMSSFGIRFMRRVPHQ